MPFFAHETAVIDEGAEIGNGTKVWHFAHICEDVFIGEDCVFGQNTMVAPGVRIGNNVKVQNNVAVYSGIEIEDDVFLGPSSVFTNVTNPRSQVVRRSIYEKTVIRRGATVGANATVVCGVTLGRYSFVGAGAVVTRDVPEYGFVIGVPARQAGWMSRHGHPLEFRDAVSADIGKAKLESLNVRGELQLAICPESKLRYVLFECADSGVSDPGTSHRVVKCLDLDEDTPLPQDLALGKENYATIKQASR